MYFVCIMFPLLESTTPPAIELQFAGLFITTAPYKVMEYITNYAIDIFLNNYGRKRQHYPVDSLV